MAEESKRLARARRWEAQALERAAKALARYKRAQEYTRIVEMQEDLDEQTEDMAKRIATTEKFIEALKIDVDAATKRTQNG